jgi:hypothetical protein
VCGRVHIENDKTYKMCITVRSACYSTHKWIRQKTDSDWTREFTRTQGHIRKSIPFINEYKNVIFNHNWHNIRWADRQSIDIVALRNLKKKEEKKKRLWRNFEICSRIYNQAIFLSLVFFLPFHLFNPTLCR